MLGTVRGVGQKLLTLCKATWHFQYWGSTNEYLQMIYKPSAPLGPWQCKTEPWCQESWLASQGVWHGFYWSSDARPKVYIDSSEHRLSEIMKQAWEDKELMAAVNQCKSQHLDRTSVGKHKKWLYFLHCLTNQRLKDLASIWKAAISLHIYIF